MALEDQDRTRLEQVILAHSPGAHIEWLADGDVNWVARVDENFVYRFPKNLTSRKQLAFEFELLTLLQGKLPTNIPKPLNLAPDNEFGIFEYLAGTTLDERTIREFPSAQKTNLAYKLANFIQALHTQSDLTLDTINNLRLKYDIGLNDGSIDDWLNKIAVKTKTIEAPIRTVFTEHFNQYLTDFPDGAVDTGELVIHSDLHNGNVLFNENNELVGIIDFSDTCSGNMYSELRQIYGMGSDIVAGILTTGLPHFEDVNVEVLRNLCITYELAILLERRYVFMRDDERSDEATEFLHSEAIDV